MANARELRLQVRSKSEERRRLITRRPFRAGEMRMTMRFVHSRRSSTA